MTEVRYLTRVPVALLRYGLYVAEPDRPWQEVPVMFQGFEIRDSEELDILRRYCHYVYVEETRSREDALAGLQKDLQVPAGEGNAQPGQTDISASLGSARHPEKHQFAKRVQSAARARAHALDFLERTWKDARLGRSVNSRQARAVVENLVAEVSGNASAAIWLTNLKRKDADSTVHSVNVCVLSLAFGMYLGLRGDELHNVGLGALLHDVGKLNQPPEILAKAAPLSATDWEIIKRHPGEGGDIVASANAMPDAVIDIIRMHHERVDGQGFPAGLQDDDFLYHARIVALVNLYDSLTTTRPYRSGRPADEVLQELYNERHLTVGPELVQEFIQCVGIYPIGSLVELDNDALGVVVGSSPDSRLRPTVLLVHDSAGVPYEKRLLLNLSAEPRRDGPSARGIRRVANPAHYDIDVTAIVAFEFGVSL